MVKPVHKLKASSPIEPQYSLSINSEIFLQLKKADDAILVTDGGIVITPLILTQPEKAPFAIVTMLGGKINFPFNPLQPSNE